MRKDEVLLNIKFLKVIKKKQCIWNYTLSDYSKRGVVRRAWKEVCREVGDTEVNCRERWRTLRNSYIKSLRTQKVDGNNKEKKKYYLADYFSFLHPFIKPLERGSLKNLAANVLKTNSEEYSTDEDTEDNYNSDINLAENVELDSVQSKEETIEENCAYKRPRDNNSSATDEAVKERRKHTKYKRREDDDSDELFVRSLVKYMKEMTSKKNRKFRLKVMGLIDTILEDSDVEDQEKIDLPATDCYATHLPISETIKQTHPVLSAMFSSQEIQKPMILPQGVVYLQDVNATNISTVRYVKPGPASNPF